MTAEAQLERLLYILPVAARGGVPVTQVADALGVTVETVLRDIETATSRCYYHPAGAVESFSISTDGDVVEVHAPHEFKRPVRLNAREALVVGLALRSLAADAVEPRRAAILDLAARLEMNLAAPDVLAVGASRVVLAEESNVEYDELALAFDDDGFRGVVADAIELRRLCTIWYLKPGEGASQHRRIAPYRLVFAHGTWYVAALDVEREGMRFFRMDRVLNAALLEEVAPEAPAELVALLSGGSAFASSDDVFVRVRYSKRVARWIVERAAGAALDGDGSVVIEHRVADPRWLVRHVLQYGGEAVVEGPVEARGWVEDAVRGMVRSA